MIDPKFLERAKAAGGVRTLTGAEFAPFTRAADLLAKYDLYPTIPDCFADRPGVVIPRTDCLLLQVAARDGDQCTWSQTIRKNHWSLPVPIEAEPIDSEIIRAVEFDGVGMTEFDGLYILTRRGHWSRRNESSALRVARAKYGISKDEAERLLGALHRDPYRRRCVPFEQEYPGDRVWNYGAPQLAHEPKAGPHPSWDAIFAHAGAALDESIPAGLAGIKTGGDYLRAWFACILRNPACRLPYLFLFGDENCGKSILWEAFALLVTGGVVKADRALVADFNGELDGAILCAVEERDISRAAGVLERAKDYITGLTLAIRRMHANQYEVPNYTHWIQSANSRGACLIPLGDTRFTAIKVGRLKSEIAKAELLDRLKAEAPAILHKMMTMPLPGPRGRLALPVIETEEKTAIQGDHVDPVATKLVEFMDELYEWQGTASQLRELIGGPPTMARLHSFIINHASYLAGHKITAEFPEQEPGSKRAKEIILRRAK